MKEAYRDIMLLTAIYTQLFALFQVEVDSLFYLVDSQELAIVEIYV